MARLVVDVYTLEILYGEERHHRFTGTSYHWGIRRPDGSLAFRLREGDLSLAQEITNNLNSPSPLV